MSEVFQSNGKLLVGQPSDRGGYTYAAPEDESGNVVSNFFLAIVLEEDVFSIVISDDQDQEWVNIPISEDIAMAHDRRRAEVVTDEFALRFEFPLSKSITQFKHYFDFAMYCAITGETTLPPLPEEDSDMDVEWITSMLSRTEVSDLPEATHEEEVEDLGTLSNLHNGGGRNECFTDSVMFSHAIVLKSEGSHASSIAAFRYDPDGFVGETEDDRGFQEFSIHDTKGHGIIATRAVLADAERHVLIQSNSLQSSIFDIDLERGAVVAEYKAQDNQVAWDVQTISCTLDDPIVSCCSKNTLFAMDRRLDSRKCVVLPSGKGLHEFSHSSITQRNRFTCHATSENGYVVVGDLLGQLRLFSGTPGVSNGARSFHPKSARTLLPGLKRPITSVDITRDGAYVVGTCDTFLIVVATTFTDDRGVQTNGFEKRMGKRKKPGVRLELTAQQIRVLGGRQNILLRNATFEAGKENAHWILATCGSYTARWSFDAVRARIEQGVSVDDEQGFDVKAAVVSESAGIQYAYLSGTAADEVTPLKFITDTQVGMRTYRATKSPVRRMK